MKKLSKAHLTRRAKLVTAAEESHGKLTAAIEAYNVAKAAKFAELQVAIEDYNTAMSDEWEKVEAAQEAYNEVVTEAGEWMSEVAGEIDDYIGERSEAWQEGEKGQAVSEWKDHFEEDLESSELEQPDGIEVEAPDDLELEESIGDMLDQLPEEV